MIKIAVTETEFDKAEAVFRGCTDIECLRAPSDEDGLAEFIRKTEAWGVIVGVDKYSGTLYEVLPAGGVIARFGVGHDGIDKNMAAATGIYCINTPGVLDTSVAECAAGLILCTARRFGENIANTRGGGWKHGNGTGIELHGKTLAVIGWGNIGSKVAAIARNGFGMRVAIHSRSCGNAADFGEFHAEFKAAVRDADFVSLHIPGSNANNDFINAERLQQMKHGAVFINTARGSLVDENALYDAVKCGHISIAALDVFKHEPYSPCDPEKDMRTLENVIMTPHIGSATQEACKRMALSALQGIRHIMNGQPEQASLLTV